MNSTVVQGRPLAPERPANEQSSERIGAQAIAPRGGRLHGATFLGMIVIVQLAWLMALGYAFLRLVA